MKRKKKKEKLNKGKSCKNHWHLWGFEPSGRTPPKLHVSVRSWPPPGTGRGNELVHQGLPPEEQFARWCPPPKKSASSLPCIAPGQESQVLSGEDWGGGKGA